MPYLKTYDLFISHAWKYGIEYKRLINLLNNAPFFYYRNYSAPKDYPLQSINGTYADHFIDIASAIERKIRAVNAVLVISGMYYNYREWMQFEVDTAVEMGKPIIAIYPYSSLHIPKEIADRADVIVHWNTASIVSAIREYSL